MKKYFYRFFFFVLLSAGFLIITPLVFEKKIKNALNSFLQKSLPENMIIQKCHMTFFKDFPSLTASLQNISFQKEKLKTFPCVKVDSLDINISFWQILKRGKIQIHSIQINKPIVRYTVQGHHPETVLSTNSSFTWKKKDSYMLVHTPPFQNLLHYVDTIHWIIKDGVMIYEDIAQQYKVNVHGIQQKGVLKKKSIHHMDVVIQTHMHALSVLYQKKNYHTAKKIALNNVIHMQMEQNKYHFKKNDLQIGETQYAFNGHLHKQTQNEYHLAFEFASMTCMLQDIIPCHIKNVLSLQKIQGMGSFSGNIQGIYNPLKKMTPSFDLQFKCAKASGQYGQTLLEHMNCEGSISNHTSQLQKTALKIKTFDAMINKKPWHMQGTIQDLVHGYWDIYAKGHLPLTTIFSTHPITGNVFLDIHSKGNWQTLQKKQYDELWLDGRIQFKKIKYQHPIYTSLTLDHGDIICKNNVYTIHQWQGGISHIPIQIHGQWSLKKNKLHARHLSLMLYSGKCDLKGQYQWQGPCHPFDIYVKANHLQLDKIFEKHSVILQQYMPILKSASGILSTQLKVAGQYFPNQGIDFQSLTSEGRILVKNGHLGTTEILQDMTKMAQIAPITKIHLQNVDLKYQVKQGKILISPFAIHMGKYATEIVGNQDFQGNMNYLCNIKADTGALGVTANSLLQSLGMGSLVPSYMQFKFKIQGHYTNPSILFLGTA